MNQQPNPKEPRDGGWTFEDFVNWRRRMGWNQAKAAQMLGRSRVMVSHYEGGIHPIPYIIEDLCIQIEEQKNLQDRLSQMF